MNKMASSGGSLVEDDYFPGKYEDMYAKPQTDMQYSSHHSKSNSALKSAKHYNSMPCSAYFVEPQEPKHYPQWKSRWSILF